MVYVARPVIEMTGVQIVVTVLWIWGSRYIYSRLYGARRLLVIYGDRDPGDVIHKMNTRRINTISAVRFISVRAKRRSMHDGRL